MRTFTGPEFVMVRFTDDKLPTFTVPKSIEEGKVEISVLGIDSDGRRIPFSPAARDNPFP